MPCYRAFFEFFSQFLDAVKKLETKESEAKKEKENLKLLTSLKEDLEDLLKAKQRSVL